MDYGMIHITTLLLNWVWCFSFFFCDSFDAWMFNTGGYTCNMLLYMKSSFIIGR